MSGLDISLSNRVASIQWMNQCSSDSKIDVVSM